MMDESMLCSHLRKPYRETKWFKCFEAVSRKPNKRYKKVELNIVGNIENKLLENWATLNNVLYISKGIGSIVYDNNSSHDSLP